MSVVGFDSADEPFTFLQAPAIHIHRIYVTGYRAPQIFYVIHLFIELRNYCDMVGKLLLYTVIRLYDYISELDLDLTHPPLGEREDHMNSLLL